MSQISQLESEIDGCQKKIQELEKKQEELEEIKRQNGQIANNIGQYIISRRNYAGKFQQYDGRTTIAKLIAGRMENAYSYTEETKLLGHYDEIDKELRAAIWKLEEEIEEQNTAIRKKQRRIEDIREEERWERARQEREKKEKERQK